MSQTLIETTANAWSQWVLTGLIESAVMLLIVLLIWGIIRKRCSQGVGYILFLLVMVKLLIPVGIPIPGFVGEWLAATSQFQQIQSKDAIFPKNVRSDAEKIANPENRDAPGFLQYPGGFNEEHNLINEYPGGFLQYPGGINEDQNLINEYPGGFLQYPGGINEDQNLINEYPGGFLQYPGGINEEHKIAGKFVEGPVDEREIRSNRDIRSEKGDREKGIGNRGEKESLSPIPYSLVPFLIWLAVVTLLLIRFAVVQWRCRRLFSKRRLIDVARFYPAEGDREQGRGNKESETLSPIPYSLPPIYASANIATPAVCGFFRPVILFPEEMLTRLSAGQLRWVLLHELAHIRRHDLQTAFVQRLAVMLHFYNPAVWVASYFMNQLRESACDDLALAALDSPVAEETIPRKMIGDALLQIVEHSAVAHNTSAGRPIRGSLGAFLFAGSVRRRLRRLLDQQRILHTKTGVGSMILLLLTTVLLVPSWQAMPMPNTPQAAENTASAPDEVPKPVLSENKQLDTTFKRLWELYMQKVVLEVENYRVAELRTQSGTVTKEELAEAERRVIKAKITLSKFIIDNEGYITRDHEIVAQEREILLGYYQRLFDLAQQDYQRAQQFAASGVITQEELRACRQKMLDAEIVVASFQFQEEQRKTMPTADAADSGLLVTAPVAKPTKFTPAEQERLKALYQQIIEQEDENRKMTEAYFNLGDPRGNYVAFMEATGGVIKAKITLSTFILNETDLTPDDYARERQNLRSLYEELRDVAKEAVKAAKVAYEAPAPQRSMQYAEVARYERKLTEVEIALIRLFPENEGK